MREACIFVCRDGPLADVQIVREPTFLDTEHGWSGVLKCLDGRLAIYRQVPPVDPLSHPVYSLRFEGYAPDGVLHDNRDYFSYRGIPKENVWPMSEEHWAP
jgi:hypothetical protein